MESSELTTADQLAEIRALRTRRLVRRWILPSIILAFSVLGFAVLKGNQPPPEKKEAVAQALLVKTESFRPTMVQMAVHSQGMVTPRTATELVSEVSGKIVEVSSKMQVGGFFHQGEIILAIDPSDYEVALKRAESTLAANRARLSQEQARAEQALLDWEKLEGRRGQQAPDLVLRKPQLAEAVAAVRFAEADVEKAQRDLERTRIRAPYDALLRAKSADLGRFVNVGSVLGNIAAVDYAEVRLPVSGDQMGFLSLPNGVLSEDLAIPVTLSQATSGQPRSWPARVVRAEGVVDERTRMQYLVARIQDPYGRQRDPDWVPLQLGQFVRAEIHGVEAEHVIKLPRHLLRPDGTVLLAGPDDTLHIATVDVLRQDPEYAYISDGIGDEFSVITTAIAFPVEGMGLRIAVESPVASVESDASGVELAADGAQ